MAASPMTTIFDLPEDVTRRYIFSLLAPADLARCESTCAAWRSAVRADDALWLASLSLAYDEPEEPPHRLEHAPAPPPVRVAYASRAKEMGGWRALAARRGRVERETSELIRDPNVADVWRLEPVVNVEDEDLWTKARRRFADTESRAWAVCAARSSRLGCEPPPSAIDPEDTHFGYVVRRTIDPGADPARRRARRRRYETIASLVSAEARGRIADAVRDSTRFREDAWTPDDDRAFACVERAAAHVSTLLWDGVVERDFRGDGVAYLGGREARSAHRVDPDAVAAALDKLGAEFRRRLEVAEVDPDASPLRAVEMLGAYFSERMRGEEDLARARDEAGPAGVDAEQRYLFERSPANAGRIPEDAFAALLDPRVPAPRAGGLRLRMPAISPGGYYQMQNSSLASVLNLHQGIPITLCVAYCGIARRGGLRPMFLNTGGHFLCAVTLRAADDGSRTVQVVDPFDDARPASRNRFELDSSQSLEGEAVVPGEIVARLLRNLTNICAARLRPPGGDVADIDSQSVAGDLGMVHQTLVTYRALIDGMRALQEGVGRETEPSDGQLWLADSLALEIQSHSIKLGERVKAFEAGEYPYPTYTPRRRDPGDA